MSGDPVLWGESLINCILMAGAIVFAILSLSDYVEILPYVIDGFLRDRPLLSLEDNLRLRRERNTVSLAALSFFCLIAARYDMVSFRFTASYASGLKTLVTLAVFSLYYLVRAILVKAFDHDSRGKENYRAGVHLYNNVMILLVTLMGLTIGAGHFAAAEDTVMKSILIHEIAIAGILLVIRELEIFSGFCNPLKAFLYLCILEFFPAGILIAAAVLF